MMRVTPKMRESPAATKNRPDAEARPSRAWNARPSHFIRERYQRLAGASPRPSRCSIRRRRPQPFHLGVRGQHTRAIDIFEINHGAAPVLQGELADESAERGLVIAGAVNERT